MDLYKPLDLEVEQVKRVVILLWQGILTGDATCIVGVQRY